MKRSEFLKWLAVVVAVYAAAYVLTGFETRYIGDREHVARADLAFKLVPFTALTPTISSALVVIWLGFRYFAGRVTRQLPAGSVGPFVARNPIHRRVALTSLLIALGSQIGLVVAWILIAFVGHGWPSDIHGWLQIDLAHVLDRIIGAGNVIVSFVEWLAASYLLYFLVFTVLRIAAGIRSLRESFARPVLVSTRTALPTNELDRRETSRR